MVYKDSAGKEIHEGDSLMDFNPRICWGNLGSVS